MDAVTLGAALLAILGGAGGQMGSQLWSGLTGLVRHPFGRDRAAGDHEAAHGCEAELVALESSPADQGLALALAEVLIARAGRDPEFQAELGTWWEQAASVSNVIRGGVFHEQVLQAHTININPVMSSAVSVPVSAARASIRQHPEVEFVGRREDLAALLGALRDPHIPLITLKGMGGIGKTALAQEAVRVVAGEALFRTTFWHSTQAEKFVGEGVVRAEVADYSLDALIDDLLRYTQSAWSVGAATAVKLRIVRDWLADIDSRALIVLDNLETVPDRDALLAALLEILGWGKILVTSRYSILRERAFTLDLEGLSPNDAIAFLTRTAERQNNHGLKGATQETLVRIRDVAGGAPLAMQLISGQMDYQPVEQVLRVLEEAGFNDMSYEFYSFLFKRIWDELDGAARKVLVAMRHFEGHPTAAAIQAAADMTDSDFYPAAAKLGQRSMLAMTAQGEARYSLHPLTRYFINTDIAAQWE